MNLMIRNITINFLFDLVYQKQLKLEKKKKEVKSKTTIQENKWMTKTTSSLSLFPIQDESHVLYLINAREQLIPCN